MRSPPSPRIERTIARFSAAASDHRSGGRRRPALSPCREWRGYVRSCDQVLVGEAAAQRCAEQAGEAVKRVAAHVAVTEAKGELADIAVQMLRRGVVIDTVDAALKDGEDALDTVRRHVAPDILASAVVDALVLVEQPADAVVNRALVRVDGRADLNVTIGEADCVAPGDAGADLRLDMAGFTLAPGNNSGLADAAATELLALDLVLCRLFAADVAFVDFHDTGQFGRIVAACFTEPSEHEPRGLLRDADLLRQLQTADALPARDEQIHGVKPFMQRHLGAFEDGIRADGEVRQAGIAAIEPILARADATGFTAGRAGGPVRPALRFEVDARAFLIGEHLEQLECRDGGARHSGVLRLLNRVAERPQHSRSRARVKARIASDRGFERGVDLNPEVREPTLGAAERTAFGKPHLARIVATELINDPLRGFALSLESGELDDVAGQLSVEHRAISLAAQQGGIATGAGQITTIGAISVVFGDQFFLRGEHGGGVVDGLGHGNSELVAVNPNRHAIPATLIDELADDLCIDVTHRNTDLLAALEVDVDANGLHFVSPCLEGPSPPDKSITTRYDLGSQVYNSHCFGVTSKAIAELRPYQGSQLADRLISIHQDNMRRIDAYLRPRLSKIDSAAFNAAQLAGVTDQKAAEAKVDQCVSEATDTKSYSACYEAARSLVTKCDDTTYLPF